MTQALPLVARGPHLPWLLPLAAGLTLLLALSAAHAAPPRRLSGKLNLNRATAAELSLLPNVGPSRAQAILTYRAQRPFHWVGQLRHVRGFGPKSLRRLRPYLAVQGTTTLHWEVGEGTGAGTGTATATATGAATATATGAATAPGTGAATATGTGAATGTATATGSAAAVEAGAATEDGGGEEVELVGAGGEGTDPVEVVQVTPATPGGRVLRRILRLPFPMP